MEDDLCSPSPGPAHDSIGCDPFAHPSPSSLQEEETPLTNSPEGPPQMAAKPEGPTTPLLKTSEPTTSQQSVLSNCIITSTTLTTSNITATNTTQAPPLSTTPVSSTSLPSSHPPSSSNYSLIATLKPFTPSHSKKSHTYTTTSTKTRTSLSLNTIFGPNTWNRFFTIPPTAPYANNTLLFQKCLQDQVGKVSFKTRDDRSRLVRVDTERQAKAMLQLTDLNGTSINAQPDENLNTCTGTISLSPKTCPVDDKNWADCSTDLLALLSEYNASSV